MYAPHSHIIAKANSGASKHYFTQRDVAALTSIKTVNNGPRVNLPNGTIVQATKSGTIPLHSSLTCNATKAHVFPALASASLISIGQLCDDGCTAVLDQNTLNVFKNGHTVLRGVRNRTDGLWDINLTAHRKIFDNHLPQSTTISTQSMNAIIRRDKTKLELAQYLHACAFSPALSSFQKAIRKGHFLTWPGIRDINFEKTLIATVPAAKGHLDQERQNLQSTKSTEEEFTEDFHLKKESEKSNEYVSLVIPFNAKTTSHTDLTGRFSYKSSSGNEYLYVLYDYDSNVILALPIKNRQAKTLATAWETLHQQIIHTGHKTKHFILDNEISTEVKNAFKKYKITFELTPPNMHRRNAAERAI